MATLSRVVMLETRTDTLVREFENASKANTAEFANQEREISRHRVMMNNTRTRLEDVAKHSRPFTADQLIVLRDLVNGQWDELRQKVNNLAQEVFEEVVEHEMALAGLEAANLDKIIPKNSTVGKQRVSLLQRMNTLQMSLKLKQKSGKAPTFDETREESSIETSINEQSDEGSARPKSGAANSTKKNS